MPTDDGSFVGSGDFFVSVEGSLRAVKLTFPPEGLKDTNDACVADSLEDVTHAVTALTELVLGLGGCEALDASPNTSGAPATGNTGEPAVTLGSLAQFATNLFTNPGLENDSGHHVSLNRGVSAGFRGYVELLLLNNGQDASKVKILALGAHPTLVDIDNTCFQHVRRLISRASTSHAGREKLVDSSRHPALLQMDARRV